jgi:hypothetical protein
MTFTREILQGEASILWQLEDGAFKMTHDGDIPGNVLGNRRVVNARVSGGHG